MKHYRTHIFEQGHVNDRVIVLLFEDDKRTGAIYEMRPEAWTQDPRYAYYPEIIHGCDYALLILADVLDELIQCRTCLDLGYLRRGYNIGGYGIESYKYAREFHADFIEGHRNIDISYQSVVNWLNARRFPDVQTRLL